MQFSAPLVVALAASLLGPNLAVAADSVAVPAQTTRHEMTAHEASAPTISDLIAKSAHDYGIPVGLAQAVVKIESRNNPKARNHGAMGLMQIKTDTARHLGFDGRPEGLLAPEVNLHYGMKVLADAYRASGGDTCRTLASYQSGHTVHRFSRAQRAYCTRARSLMARA